MKKLLYWTYIKLANNSVVNLLIADGILEFSCKYAVKSNYFFS